MEGVTRQRGPEGLRLQYELLVDPAARKVLTLEQAFAVFRRTVLPESVTWEDSEAAAEDTLGVFQNGGAVRYFHSRTGQFTREGRRVRYGLDDDLVNNEDGTITAVFLWWEAEEDEQVERWFRALAREMEEAQENLVLFGRI